MPTAPSLSLYEILDLIATNSNKIDFLWNFFVGVHLAVLGGLIVMPSKIQLFEKLLAIAAYCAFSYMNHNAIVDAYDYHFVLIDAVKRIAISPNDAGHVVLNFYDGFDLRGRIWFFPYVHLAAAVIVVTALAFANRFVSSPAKSATP